MPITDADAEKIALAGWKYSHGDDPDVHQTLATAAVQATRAATGITAISGKLDAQSQVINKLVSTVATLVSGVSDLDPAQLAAELKQEIAAIKVNVEVTGPPAAPNA